MWTVILAFGVLWLSIVTPVLFFCAFEKQIIAILEAYAEYIKTKTRILQEVNKNVSD